MGEDNLYENLLRATDNTNDITNEKYGTITKINGNICSVKEDGTDLEHSNIPILNGLSLDVGDKVVLGFAENSIYNVFVIGSLGETRIYNKKEIDDIKNEIDTSLINKSDSNHTHRILDLNLDGLVNWLKSWFYDKPEVDNLVSGATSYRTYKLEPSTYNAKLNSTMSLLVTVLDIKGDPVPNHTFDVKVKIGNNSPITLSTTSDSNGQANLTNITLNDIGVADFLVGNEHCQVKIYGWKTLSLTNMAGFTLYYNDYFCHLVMNRSGTLPTAGAYTNLVSGTIPSGYRPKIATTIFADGTSTIRVKVNDSGNVLYYTERAFTSSATIRGTFTWARI